MSDKPREWWIGKHKIIVDEGDYDFLMLFKWSVRKNKSTYYAISSAWFGKRHGMCMHRLLTGLRNVMVDHKNRNGLDNRRSNLRFCTARENSYNRVRKNSYGYRGVYKPANSSNFAFQIQANGKKFHKRGFKTAKEAARAYDILNKELHGEFGIRNFKD